MDKKIVCQNRKASHEYFIDEVFEAGIVLIGPEAKSLRQGRASLTDGYARVKNGEVFLYNMHITPYPYTHYLNLEPKRMRLVHSRQGGPASLVLVEGRKNGRPGLEVEVPLYVYQGEGRDYSDEVRGYYSGL